MCPPAICFQDSLAGVRAWGMVSAAIFFSPGLGHVSASEGIMVAALDMISYLRS